MRDRARTYGNRAGSGGARTGIDCGAAGIRVVRAEGGGAIERVTHVDSEEIAAPSADPVEAAARALGAVLERMRVRGRGLGRVAVGVKIERGSLRDVVLPEMSQEDLHRALPYEARRHLMLEGMEEPLLACQVLGPAPPEEGAPQMRVLLAAVPREDRAFPLAVLDAVGIDPEVVDLEPLAALNALRASLAPEDPETVCLVDLGSAAVRVQIGGRDGRLLVRSVRDVSGEDASPETLADQVRGTLEFYRGRHREEVARLHLCGGGALRAGLGEALAELLALPVAVADPFRGITIAATRPAGEIPAARFLVAAGLCRWWDRDHT